MSTTKKFGTSLEKAMPTQVVIKPKSKSPTGIWQFVWKSKLEPRMFSHQNHCHHETPLKFKMLKCLFEIKCTRLHKHFESSNFKDHLYSGNGSADENTCKNILNDKSCNSKSMHKLQFLQGSTQCLSLFNPTLWDLLGQVLDQGWLELRNWSNSHLFLTGILVLHSLEENANTLVGHNTLTLYSYLNRSQVDKLRIRLKPLTRCFESPSLTLTTFLAICCITGTSISSV